MRYWLVPVVACSLLFVAAPAAGQKVIVGEHVEARLGTPHPHPAGDGQVPQLVWVDEIHHPGATYVAPHFARFELAPGDYVVVRSPDGAQRWTYAGLGRGELGRSEDGFFAVHLKGERARIELWAVNREPGWGFEIDRYGRGYSDEEIRAFWAAGLGEKMNLPRPPGADESICTADDSEEAKCYELSEPLIYDRSRAVTRLLLNSNALCTGWLVGCDGHVMTNEHCIGSQGTLNNVDFEFMAEGADCATNCEFTLACPGVIEAGGGTLVAVNTPLDYSLVLPDTSVGGGTDLPATYGFLQLRDTGAVLDERIYLPGHPAGWGKHISVESSYPLEPNPPFASAVSLNETACSGAPASGDVGYWADTQGGSSGSPVLAYADHRVVALHHCRGSGFCATGSSPPDDPNRGVPIEAVIADLGAALPNCAVCDPPDPPANLTATAAGDNRIDLAWDAVAGADSYNVYRALGGCPQSGYEQIASGVAGTAYSDTTASGGVTYAYVVRAFDLAEGCESFDSNCADAQTTGLCTLPPDFAGLESVTNAGTASCALDLAWSPASPQCGATVVYNVHRSTTPGFDPDAGNLLAACVAGTAFQDATPEYATEYFFVVRAEDAAGAGAGQCAGGSEDGNTVELSGVATGPDVEQFADDVESGPANWTVGPGPGDTGTDPWEIVDTDSHSPTHSWFVSDQPVVKDQLLALAAPVAVPAGPPVVLEFWHHHDTEANWDGGVLEFSLDGGATWLDVLDGNPDRFLEGGYVSALNASANPLGGRQAWHGDSGGFFRTQVDVTDVGGQSVLFRWRLGCDASVGDVGWWVDDVRVFFGSACDALTIFADGFESGDTTAWSGSVP